MSTTDKLTAILKSTHPEDLDAFFGEHWDAILSDSRPFAAYMRTLLRAKGVKQSEMFIRADVPEHYGYRLVSEERHTSRRDVILRLCIGGGLTLEETQKALKLYGMSPLYPRIPRDAVLMAAVNNGSCDVNDADALLQKHGLPLLEKCGNAD